jgi:uncharacterized membrane protein
MDVLSAVSRWLHVVAGIVWIGFLYFFNFVNGPFQGTIDGETKKKVNPELLPRALYFFRMGAAWTWFTGILLLLLVFYHGRITLEPEVSWGPLQMLLVALVFAAPFIYDALHKSPLGKDPKTFGAVSFVLAAAYICTLSFAGFTYRGYNIHLAGVFGTIMAYNVWFRIWPAQQKIIAAVKAGTAPDGALVALAGARSRHNTYMSVPLVWGMINQHTTYLSGGNLGIPKSLAFAVYLVIVLVGWHLVFQLYKKAGQVKGF